MHRLGFQLLPRSEDEPWTTVVPVLDGVPLTEIVERFESTAGFDVAGGYAGIEPGSPFYGDLFRHYFAANVKQWPEPGAAWLLACDCGEPGCWPFTVWIEADDREVCWYRFENEHRRGRDYSGFGPFGFDRRQYESALAELVETLRR